MSQQDDIKAFNKYCAEVMGYEIFPDLATTAIYHAGAIYQPYSNLNQLAEVFDKVAFSGKYDCAAYHLVVRNPKRYEGGVATAMREFIWSTHDS